MAYTTNQLISDAYHASGVVSREFETVSGSQIADGLQWLNDVITDKTVENAMVPYETTYTFNAVIGQEQYPIPNLIQIDTLVFYLNSVRYAMVYTPRNQYFGSPRVENITTLPNQWYWERGFGGGNLYIYFEPDQNYPMEIHGTFRLSTVALGQDLSLTIDQFYISYLRYALAHRICVEFSYDTPPNVQQQLKTYEAWIAKKSRILDLRMQKLSTLHKRSEGGVNWAFVNIGRGFLPYG